MRGVRHGPSTVRRARITRAGALHSLPPQRTQQALHQLIRSDRCHTLRRILIQHRNSQHTEYQARGQISVAAATTKMRPPQDRRGYTPASQHRRRPLATPPPGFAAPRSPPPCPHAPPFGRPPQYHHVILRRYWHAGDARRRSAIALTHRHLCASHGLSLLHTILEYVDAVEWQHDAASECELSPSRWSAPAPC